MTNDTRKERGLCELYAEDPERADALLFGRVAYPDRRGFLKGAGLAAMAAAVGASIPFHRNFPAGLIPSVMCHFAVTLAIALAVLVSRERRLAVGEDKRIQASHA